MPAISPEPEEDKEISEAQCILDHERLTRVIDALVETSTRPGPHVHGVEQGLRSKFWAVDSDESSDEEEEIESIDTPEFVRRAVNAGFSMDELVKAGHEEGSSSYNSLCNSSLDKCVVDTVIQRNAGKPWTGPLPKPWKSPPMTLGAAISKAKVISPDGRAVSLSPPSARPSSNRHAFTSKVRRSPEPEMVTAA